MMTDLFTTKKFVRKALFDKIREFQKENELKNSEVSFILADAISFWAYQTAKAVEAYENDRNDSL